MKKFYQSLLVVVLIASAGYQCNGQNKEAIKAGLHLIESRSDSLKADEFILFNYLQRRFDLNILQRKQNSKYLNRWFDEDSSQTLVYQFRSLVDDSQSHHLNVGLADHPIDSVSLLALNCQDEFSKEKFLSRLRLHGNKGGYYLTHALLSLQWAIENNCLVSNDKLVEDLKLKLQNACLDFALNSSAPQDERFEAICMLYYTSFDREKLKPYSKQVLKTQLPDGGWASSERLTNFSLHTTAFAIWILLEHDHSVNRKYEPWVYQ